MANNFLQQTRVWIGPAYSPNTDPAHYDWTQHSADDIGFDSALPRAVLSSQMGDTDTVINYTLIAPMVAFPNEGGLWIAPGNTSQGWEYITYTNNNGSQFQGVERQNLAEMEQSGVHAAGSGLYLFYPLTEDPDEEIKPTASGEIHLSKRLELSGAVEDWSAALNGYNLPRHAIRNHHMAVVERRKYGPDGPGTYEIWLIGWLQNTSGNDNAQRLAVWSAEIVSISAMLNRYEIAGVDVGPRDIAKDGSATASTPLSFAYKERSSGDYTAAEPDLTAKNVLDRDYSTLWIADQYVGDRNYLDDNGDPHWNGPDTESRFLVTVVYLRRPLGLPSRGYRFIELTVVPFAGETATRDVWLMTADLAVQYELAIGEDDVAEGNKIILCEDQSLWQEENPVNGAEQIHEIPIDIFDAINPEGDTLAFVEINTPFHWVHGVSWGGTGTIIKPLPTATNFVWQGTTQAGAAPYGDSLRYTFKGTNGLGSSLDASDYWAYSKVVSPGYTIGEYGTDDNRWNAGKITPVWLQVDLPDMQLVLTEDLPADQDLGILLMHDAAETPSTQGLSATPSYIQIAEEVIAYDYKTDEGVNLNGRGRFSTTQTDHKAGDTVMVRDTTIGFATAAPPITSISWSRPENSTYPLHFTVYTSIYEKVRHPDNAEWEDDWEERAVVSGWTPDPDETGIITWNLDLGPIRAKSIMIVIYEMSEDPYRPRINEVYAGLSKNHYSDESWMDDGESAGLVIAALLARAGLADTAYTIQAGTLAPQGYTVETGYAWQTIADVADYTNTRLTVGLDSKINVAPNTLWTAAAHTADFTWRRDEITDLSISAPAPAPLKQIEVVYYIPPDGAETSVIYPADADAPDDGEIQQIGMQVYGSAVDAYRAATRRYNYARWPYTAVAELAAVDGQAASAPEPRPGQFAKIEWEFGPDEGEYARYSRAHLIDSVDTFIDDNGEAATTVALTQIDRSSYE